MNAASPQKQMVELFYNELWNRRDKRHIPTIFHEDFTFRGSLGPVLVGYEPFALYVDRVCDALDRYTCDILTLIEEGPVVSGKLLFHGIHRGTLLGFAPTGKRLEWHGAPFFTFEGDRVRDLWVLGDVHGLIEQMKANAEPAR